VNASRSRGVGQDPSAVLGPGSGRESAQKLGRVTGNVQGIARCYGTASVDIGGHGLNPVQGSGTRKGLDNPKRIGGVDPAGNKAGKGLNSVAPSPDARQGEGPVHAGGIPFDNGSRAVHQFQRGVGDVRQGCVCVIQRSVDGSGIRRLANQLVDGVPYHVVEQIIHGNRGWGFPHPNPDRVGGRDHIDKLTFGAQGSNHIHRG